MAEERNRQLEPARQFSALPFEHRERVVGRRRLRRQGLPQLRDSRRDLFGVLGDQRDRLPVVMERLVVMDGAIAR